jgi:hypothetical protein
VVNPALHRVPAPGAAGGAITRRLGAAVPAHVLRPRDQRRAASAAGARIDQIEHGPLHQSNLPSRSGIDNRWDRFTVHLREQGCGYALMTGQEFAGYSITRRLASGGMTYLYVGVDAMQNRVVIRRLKPDYVKDRRIRPPCCTGRKS